MDNFTIETDADGIAIVSFDMPGRPINTITHAVQRELGELAQVIRQDERIVGAILRSGKASGFCAGADLKALRADMDRWKLAETQDELRGAVAEAGDFSRRIRVLETLGKPIVAIVDGVALGGGLELALGCHYRIGIKGSGLRLGLPEAGLGLMPGGGGTQRLPRIAGLAASLPYILDGVPIDETDALSLGIINEMADRDHALDLARLWIGGGGSGVARWDEKRFRLPDGGPHSPTGYGLFAPAVAARRGAAGRQADAYILKALYEGSQVPIDAGLRIETRYFLQALRSPAAAQQIDMFLSKSSKKAVAA